MPFKCCVTGCRGNYDAGSKCHVFSFPNDEKLKLQWQKAIPRKDFTYTKNSKVCEKHFITEDVIWTSSAFDESTGRQISVPLRRPKLKPGAVPQLFPGCPSYLSSSKVAKRKSPEAKKRKLEEEALSKVLTESIASKEEYDKARSFSNLKELEQCAKEFLAFGFWDMIVKQDCLMFLNIESCEGTPVIHYALVIDQSLEMSLSFRGHILPHLTGVGSFPMTVDNINNVQVVLDVIENMGKNQASDRSVSVSLDIIKGLLKIIGEFESERKQLLDFISEQLSLMSNSSKSQRYCIKTLIFASVVFLISPHAYRFLRHSEHMILPHPNTIKNLSSRLSESKESFLAYAKRKAESLESHEMYVSLMFDEIHLKEYFDYKGGSVAGVAFDREEAASTAFVFMIGSILSKYKDVVHIMPTKQIASETLFTTVRDVILGLESAGFLVLVVVSDNNAINRKAMAYFSSTPKLSFVYPHPADNTRPLFYAIDSVHLIKCVRNNWLNQKNPEMAMYFPEFESLSVDNFQVASFHVLRKIYETEAGNLLKYSYTLSKKALWPSNLERQNVNLALQIFNTQLPLSLMELGSAQNLTNLKGTASYITIFSSWFKIMNVKTPSKGKRLRDEMCEPLKWDENDQKLLFLTQFLEWLKKWEGMKCNTGGLSRETHSALELTTNCMIEFTRYCNAELGMHYVLPGKIQTDELEYRFGQYRRMAGTQYHISVRQIYEVERKIRLLSTLDLHLNSSINGPVQVDKLVDSDDFATQECSFPHVISVSDHDIEEATSLLPVITYIAGYCAHSAIKRLKCTKCKDNLLRDELMEIDTKFALVSACDRGGLKYPETAVINAVLHNYIIVQKLVSEKFEKDFLSAPSQQGVVLSLTYDELISKDQCITGCANNHSSEKITKMIIRSSSNTLLNNYCKTKNDKLVSASKARKLKTLTK